MKRPSANWSRLVAIASVAVFVIFVFSSSRGLAVTTHNVNVGGEFSGSPLAKGGVVWFNGYDPETIVIQAGDTVVWHLVGGVHTVTSTDTTTNGSFVFDSSPLFTPAAALADMGPGKLLPPGSVFELNTSTLALGTYRYFCKIHPGMMGNLTVTGGLVNPRIVTATAGWGDTVYAVQAFAPENLTLARGTLIRWTLANPMEPHTITGVDSSGAGVWDSSPNFTATGPPPVMLLGDTFSWPFNSPGTYTYFCKVHAYKIGESWVGMVGTVIVEPSDALAAVSYASLGIAIVALVVAIYAVVRRKP